MQYILHCGKNGAEFTECLWGQRVAHDFLAVFMFSSFSSNSAKLILLSKKKTKCVFEKEKTKWGLKERGKL